MQSKLILTLEESLISVAKHEAARRKISVSNLVAEILNGFLKKPSNMNKHKVSKKTSVTDRLFGSLPLVHNAEDQYKKHLETKHS